MTKGQFIELVLDPSKAADYLPDEIGAWVEQFPYCQPLRFLQLRCFSGRQSIQYPAALKITSAYAPDRSRLFHLINPTMESGHGLRSTTLSGAISDTVETTAEREEQKGAKDTEASGTVHFEAKREVNQPPMQVVSGNDAEITLEPPTIETQVIPYSEELLAGTQKHEFPTEDIRETEEQELLIQRLKELNLWPEDEEETITGATGSDDTPPTPEIEVLHGNPGGQDATEEELKDTALQFEYEKKENTTADAILPVTADYFSLPGTEGEGGIVLNDHKGGDWSENTSLKAVGHAPDKLTFSEWLKSLDKETQSGKDRMIQGTVHEGGTDLGGQGKPEKKPSVPAVKESSHQESAKSKVIYSRETTGKITRHPRPGSTDEITGSINQVQPSGPSEKPSGKKPLPDPMLVATDPPKPKLPTDQLIEKFITEEPRITPSKSTFYSPVNMARKSVMETEDLVTETLAGIFARQGNFQKAIQYYEKLSLKFPEKSRYFAGLIEELKKKLNYS